MGPATSCQIHLLLSSLYVIYLLTLYFLQLSVYTVPFPALWGTRYTLKTGLQFRIAQINFIIAIQTFRHGYQLWPRLCPQVIFFFFFTSIVIGGIRNLLLNLEQIGSNCGGDHFCHLFRSQYHGNQLQCNRPPPKRAGNCSKRLHRNGSGSGVFGAYNFSKAIPYIKISAKMFSRHNVGIILFSGYCFLPPTVPPISKALPSFYSLLIVSTTVIFLICFAGPITARHTEPSIMNTITKSSHPGTLHSSPHLEVTRF